MPKPYWKRWPTGDITLRFKNGRSLVFSEVMELYLKRDAWKGIKQEASRETIEKMYEEFNKVKVAFDRLDAGEKPKAVAGSIGVSRTTLRTWQSGKQLPRIISAKMIKAYIDMRKKYLDKAAMANPRMGYILGSRMSSHVVGTQLSKRGTLHVAFGVKNGTIGSEFKRAFKEVFGTKMRRRRRKGTEYLRKSSAEIGQFLNMATMYGEHIPHSYLKNREVRREFTKALVDANAYAFKRTKKGRKRPEQGIIFRTRNRELRDYLSAVLKEFGIENSPREGVILSPKQKWQAFVKEIKEAKKERFPAEGKRYGIFIPISAFEKFRREIGFREPAKARKVDEILAAA